jgi:hypothetical protein
MFGARPEYWYFIVPISINTQKYLFIITLLTRIFKAVTKAHAHMIGQFCLGHCLKDTLILAGIHYY